MAGSILTEQSQPKNVQDIGIKQLNLGYSPEQDRLLLKLGLSDQTELQVWITYRIAKLIWQFLNVGATLPNSQSIKQDLPPEQAVEQFKQEVEVVNQIKKLDFESAYKQDDYQLHAEVAQQPESFLATHAELIAQANGQTMSITCANGFNLSLNLNADITLAICTMLQLTCKEANWPMAEGKPMNTGVVFVNQDKKQVIH
jgi:hypothetical protein